MAVEGSEGLAGGGLEGLGAGGVFVGGDDGEVGWGEVVDGGEGFAGVGAGGVGPGDGFGGGGGVGFEGAFEDGFSVGVAAMRWRSASAPASACGV